MIRSRIARTERGFSLIETIAALFVFTLVTVGVAPLIASSLQGSTLSRSYTAGKSVALEAMEQIRGLPYFVSYASQPKKVDVLDMYFPCADATKAGCAGYSTTDHSFTTQCASTNSSQACAFDLPQGYTVSIVAQFVVPGGPDPNDPGSEKLNVVQPPSTYAWNVVGQDIPESRLLKLSTKVSWSTVGGRSPEFTLSSLIGERKFGKELVRGTGKVDYVVQVIASYRQPATGAVTNLQAVGGQSESRLETRLLSTAEQSTHSGFMRITTEATDTTAATERARIDGASSVYIAPPDRDPAAGATALLKRLTHPDLALDVGLLDATETTNLKVKVANEQPTAQGDFRFKPGTTGSDKFDFWVQPQAETGESAALQLDPLKPVFGIRQQGGTTLSGGSSGVTGALGAADRRVETSARGSFGRARLFPVLFIPGGSTDPKSIVLIDSFTSSVGCKAIPNGTPSATHTYSATLRFWEDTSNNSAIDGSYQSVPLGSLQNTTVTPATQDPLAGLGPAFVNGIATGKRNPMVLEDIASVTSYGSQKDVLLFSETHTHQDPTLGTITHNHKGYIEKWSAIPKSVLDAGGKTESNGTAASAGLEAPITISTVPADPSIPQSGLGITIGKLSCDAVDNR